MDSWEGAPPHTHTPPPRVLSSLKLPPRTLLQGRLLATEPYRSCQGGGEQPCIPAGTLWQGGGGCRRGGCKAGGGEDRDQRTLTPALGPSQVAEQFIFLAPVHLGCPLAGTLLVCPFLGHRQRDVEVQKGAGC